MAQNVQNGTISGTVYLPTGEPVAGATARLSGTGIVAAQRVVVSGSAGRFAFLSVPPGTYKVTVSMEDFTTFVQENIVLTSAEKVDFKVPLEIAAIEGSIVVNAAGAWADQIADLAGAIHVGLQPRKRNACIIVPSACGDVREQPRPAMYDAFEKFPIGGIYLLIRRTISFHIPAAVMLSVFVFAGAAYLINSDAYASPVFHLCAGGLLIGAFFIATDPVTAPLSTKGMWIFGIGVGTITMLIRIVGEYPEGVMYSVLLMNAVTPLIDRFCKLVPAGGKPNV